MSGSRNIFFALFVLLALIGGTWAYFKLKEIKKPSEDALLRLPAKCSVYLYTHDVFELNNRLNTRSLILDKFSDLPPLSGILRSLDFFCIRASENPILEETFRGNGLHFASYPEKKYWLISINLKELGKERIFQLALSESFKTKKLNTEIYSLDEKAIGTLFLKYRNGGICISNSQNALNDAYNIELPRLKNDTAFAAYSADFEESSLLSVYIQHQHIKKENAYINLNVLQNQGSTAGQLEIQPSQLIFNGSMSSGKNQILDALLLQKPTKIELQAMLPYGCSALKAYGFQNFSSIFNKTLLSNATISFWEMVNDSAMFDVQSDFYNNINSSVCEFSAIGIAAPNAVCGVTDTVKTHEQLQHMSDTIDFIGEKKIYRLIKANEIVRLFDPLNHVSCAYAFIHESYLYFCENSEAAKFLSQTLTSGNTLEKNKALMSYAEEQFPEAFNMLIYSSASELTEKINDFYPASKKTTNENFKGLKHSSVSLISLDDNFKLRWQLAFENETDEGGEKLLWTLKLDSSCSMKPVEFTNHLSGEKEIIIQDDDNKLYLVNSKGKVLWKKQLNEKICSEIYVVDMFRNNKNQMLFSTNNYIHLIDRNGKYVESYPVKTPSKITSHLCVFDYEGKRDYRLLFACSNKKIYNYTIYGIRNEGFTSFKTAAEVNLPIQYVKIGLSDYLIATDQEGNIYAISRKGDLRLRLSNRTLVPCQKIFVDASKNLQSSKLIFLDEKERTLHKISLADKKEILNLNKEDPILCFNFCLVDENKSMDLVLATAKEIGAFNLNGNPLFESKAPFELSDVNFYSDQNHLIYYGWSQASLEMFLYENRKNEVRKLKAGAMPMFINLFRNNKIYLVYPENDRLNCLAY